MEEHAAGPHPLTDEAGVTHGDVAEVGIAEDTRSLGEGGEGEAVPGGQHLVVGLGRDTPGAGLEERALPALDAPCEGSGIGGAGEGVGAAGEDVAPDQLGVVRVVKVALR